jgi:starch synthase
MTETRNVVMAASEALPFGKAGGLGDAVPALARALSRIGMRVRLFLPHYERFVDRRAELRPSPLGEVPVPLGDETEIARFLEARLPGSEVEVVLVGCARLFDRDGLYDDPETGTGYPDNGLRYAFFQRAVVEALRQGEFRPDVVHVHDNQAALIPLMLRSDPSHPDRDAGTVLTIHNLGYQGIYGKELLPALGLPPHLARPMAPLEFHGSLNMLKGGIVHADRITTVSPRYASEILTPEFGCGLEGVLREREGDVVGILNGVDYEQWDPRHDPHLPAAYGPDSPDRKADCQKELLRELDLRWATDRVPVLGFIGRLTEQKGVDLLAAILDRLLERSVRVVLLGTGNKMLEERLAAAAKRHPTKMAAVLRYDEGLAHRITAGADVFLMPSMYEPCGLNQMYALRYGTLPLVRETGGLADTIRDLDDDPADGNGFVFHEPTPRAMLGTILRALDLRERRPEAWDEAVRRAMTEDNSWDRSATAYRKAYDAARVRKEAVTP